jgi:predicted dehydrogenase
MIRKNSMTLRLIQVGLGGWGSSWAENIVRPYKNVETVTWVEIVPAALQIARKRLALPEERCFTSLEDALNAFECDAVLVTASLPGHVPNALAALQAGKHVLMEKPFAPTIAEAQQLVELAEQQRLILMISQNYRFIPTVEAVVPLVREQILGRVSSVNIDFRRYANNAPVETNPHYRIWHPLLADMSIHHFDLMRLVLGQDAVQVTCKLWNPSWSHFVSPPAGVATITFEDGTIVNYRGNWVSPVPYTNWSGEWSMECEKGEIFWTGRGERGDRVTLRSPGEEKTSPVTLPTLQYADRSGSLHAFYEAVRTGVQPASSGRDNLKTLALMLAAIKSAETGLPVDIPQMS